MGSSSRSRWHSFHCIAMQTKQKGLQKKPAGNSQEDASSRSWSACGQAARTLRDIYETRFPFPEWTCDELESGALAEHARSTVVYYNEDLPEAKELALHREPVNIGMKRFYDEEKLHKAFGYKRGAYSKSTTKRLMQNIAIFCKTPCRSSDGEELTLNVINLIGYAFDSPEQPDYKYFFSRQGCISDGAKWMELVERMQQVWRYAFECARLHKFKYIYVADVGGGAFSHFLNENSEHTSYAALKEESFPVVKEEFSDLDVEVLQLPRIPDWAFTPEGRERAPVSLLVNAWDPWSMVGNGNFGDMSLDGFFGRCTAMAVLCWPNTNPHLRYEKV